MKNAKNMLSVSPGAPGMKAARMHRLTLMAALCLSVPICLVLGCARPRPGSEDRQLVVCTSEREELMDAVIPLFEEKYGIQVSLIQGENGELLEQVRQGELQADVVMGLSLSDISDSQQLFQEYVSVNDKYLLESYQNTDGYATSYVLSGSCLIVNQTLAGEYAISGYRDLLNPELKGKITMADPSSSSTGGMETGRRAYRADQRLRFRFQAGILQCCQGRVCGRPVL